MAIQNADQVDHPLRDLPRSENTTTSSVERSSTPCCPPPAYTSDRLPTYTRRTPLGWEEDPSPTGNTTAIVAISNRARGTPSNVEAGLQTSNTVTTATTTLSSHGASLSTHLAANLATRVATTSPQSAPRRPFWSTRQQVVSFLIVAGMFIVVIALAREYYYDSFGGK